MVLSQNYLNMYLKIAKGLRITLYTLIVCCFSFLFFSWFLGVCVCACVHLCVCMCVCALVRVCVHNGFVFLI